MQNPKLFDYKGYHITARCTELGPLSDRRTKRFDAFFRVYPSDPHEESWQQFPKGVFETCAGATANALTAAKRSIDVDLRSGERELAIAAWRDHDR
jgi:hypothetical protein